jgi:hypothetical protein
MCTIAREQYKGEVNSFWTKGLQFIGMIRMYIVVPHVISVVPLLMVFRGGDAFNICMNTVAVLFFFDLDNFIYSHGLPSKVTEEFEAHNRISLKDRDYLTLERTKFMYTVLVPIFLIGSVQGLATNAKYTTPYGDYFVSDNGDTILMGWWLFTSILEAAFGLRGNFPRMALRPLYAIMGFLQMIIVGGFAGEFLYRMSLLMDAIFSLSTAREPTNARIDVEKMERKR